MNTFAVCWLILAVILGIIEASTPALVCIWFAISALIVSVFAIAGINIWLQIGIFIILSVILIILTRPLAKKYVSKKTIATNADRIIGAEGVVVTALNPIENQGQVKVMGQIWSAKPCNNQPIPEGTLVTVKQLEGVKVIVVPK